MSREVLSGNLKDNNEVDLKTGIERSSQAWRAIKKTDPECKRGSCDCVASGSWGNQQMHFDGQESKVENDLQNRDDWIVFEFDEKNMLVKK